jgi:hypothetical protein
MENEKQVEITESEVNDYIQAIADLKANSVPMDKYLKVKDENKKLLDSLVRGDSISQDQVKPRESMADLRKSLYGSGSDSLSNLDYWTKTLELREQIMESGKEDPFVPQGHNIVATEEDRAAAQRVADVVKHCIEVADGDSLVFTNELQRRTADVNVLKPRRK